MSENSGNDFTTGPSSLTESEGTTPYPAQQLPTTRFMQSNYPVPYNAEYSDDIPQAGHSPYLSAESTTTVGFAAQDLAGAEFANKNVDGYSHQTMPFDSQSLADSGNDFLLHESALMSAFLGNQYDETLFQLTQAVLAPDEAEYWGCGSVNGGIATGTRYYKMLARDVDCPSTSFVSWVVINTPDPSGMFYLGLKCGSSPLADVAIEAEWFIPN